MMKMLHFENNDAMPILGLGTWKSSPENVYAAVREALRIGYRHIDCAAIYGNEAAVGKALAEAIAEGTIRREDLFVTSKLWNNAHDPDRVADALKKSLADLSLDYLDLYLIHWPVALKPDVVYPRKGDDFITLDDLPLASTWQAMIACRAQGLTRHIGVSNVSVKKLEGLIADTGVAPEMNQVELHPFLQQKPMLTFCSANGILLTAYSPLGSGDRPKPLKAPDEPSLLENPTVMGIAENTGYTPAQVLIGWAMERGCAVIPKSVNPERLAENLAAADVSLSKKDMDDLASLDRHLRFIRGNFWTLPGSGYTLENLWDEN